MDLLGEVTKASKKLEQAEARYLEAMRARNVAVRAARDQQVGPGKIGQAAELTPEQVRRICAAADPTPGAGTRPRQRV